MEVPGLTITAGDPDLMVPIMNNKKLFPRQVRRNVVIASSNITDHSIFTNGLFQNVYFIYMLLENMGYNPILMFNEKHDPTKVPEFMKSIRVKVMEDIAREPFPVFAFIEIAMSISPHLRGLFKRLGARIIKIYLGNILNIDIETPIFYPQMHFSHHVVGEVDEVWVSPHYEMHREYAATLNHVPLTPETSKIAPYVWDPAFLTNFGKRDVMWKPKRPSEEQVILIMEPNISFQKASIVPLLIVEAYCRARPDWTCKVVVVNGQRIKDMPYGNECFLNRLDIYNKGRVELTGRLDMRSAMEKYPSAIPICHQFNNEYNYMLFEYFYGGWPVIHNAESWSSAGYFYKDSDIQAAAQALDFAVRYHEETFETAVTQAKPVIWRHSIHNPKVHEAWYKLLGGRDKAMNL
jgi:hypothetical protein